MSTAGGRIFFFSPPGKHFVNLARGGFVDCVTDQKQYKCPQKVEGVSMIIDLRVEVKCNSVCVIKIYFR
jgi:hypothetical protein